MNVEKLKKLVKKNGLEKGLKLNKKGYFDASGCWFCTGPQCVVCTTCYVCVNWRWVAIGTGA